MKRFLKSLVIMIVACSFLISLPNSLTGEGENENSVYGVENVNIQEEVIGENYNDNNPKRPDIPKIPLDDDLLDYIYNLSEENGISYTYLLAIIKTESNFDPKARSHTNDLGLFQINKSNIKFFSEMAEIKDPDPYNPYHNTAMAVSYISYLMDYWSNYGYSEEDKFYLVTISYNRGIVGAKRYIKKHGWNNSYVNKILKTKEEIEEKIDERF
jgi:Soluble lytic murein transglycosylase and related regulatory proteins (some contain LysM/invasin domains)